VDFAYNARTEEYRESLLDFMDTHVYPNELRYERELAAAGDAYVTPAVVEELKTEARSRGLWNLFLPDEEWGAGLSNLEYAPLAEISGRSPFIAPDAINCAAPDTGNMELLAGFASPELQRRFLVPLLEGEIRSCFSMTEPDTASSDATNIDTRIERRGDVYRIQGRKWWSHGALSDRCRVAILLGVTDPDADRHRRHSMIVVPLDAPGVRIERTTTVFGYVDHAHGGHAVIHYDDVEVPVGHLLGEEGGGFAIAQARLGPGRIHHCMRLIGMAERAFDHMCARAHEREPFGRPLAEQGVVREWIAEARIRIEQARLLVLKTAWLMDTVGNKGAQVEISAIKVAVPEMASWVIDRAIQTFGGAGVSDDTPLAALWTQARLLRIADGPDEVHKMSLAKRELQRYAPLD
jgi:acyl-CoA dehydrogenase